jgi:hypothetical protein
MRMSGGMPFAFADLWGCWHDAEGADRALRHPEYRRERYRATCS